MRRTLPAVGAWLLWSAVSAAETATPQLAGDSSRAEELFREGRELMQQGRQADACPKFAESYRLEATVGTVINLGVCYEAIGKTASAWASYRTAVVEATRLGHEERAEAVKQRLAELDARLSRIRIDTGQVARDSTVLLDGRAVERSAVSQGVPVDPGVHSVVVTEANHELFRAEVPVSETDRMVYVPISVTRVPSKRAESRYATKAATPRPSAAADAPSPNRKLGLSLAGSGLAVAAVGSIFAWKAHQRYEDAIARCPNPDRCASSTALSLRRDADKFDIIATSTLASAALLVGTGCVIYFWTPTGDRPGVALLPTPRGGVASFAGTF